MNSLFRRESGPLASELIRDALAVTRWFYGDAPPLGLITFIDESKVRHKRDPGRSYLRAGFRRVGETVGGLLAFQILPDEMPAAHPPAQYQNKLAEILDFTLP